MAALWSAKPSAEPVKAPASPTNGASDVADNGLPGFGEPAPHTLTSVPMTRPQLQRNQSQPPSPQQPPLPLAPQQPANPNDSLSLMQLRRIVTEFPKVDPTSYAFTYADTASFEEELNEWFSYNEAEFRRLLRAKDTFQRRWKKFAGKPWLESSRGERDAFVRREINGLHATDLRRRCKSLQSVLSVMLGVWEETAGTETPPENSVDSKHKIKACKLQLEHMTEGILLVADAGGVELLYEVMQNAFNRLWDDEFRGTKLTEEDIPFIQDELDNVTTVIYLFIEGVRYNPEDLEAARIRILNLNPTLVKYFLMLTAKLRWDDANELPQTRVFLLFWKSILLSFGGTAEIDRVKKATSEFRASQANGGLITASPLDYHIFRQEITSKYPAYIPPPPLLPLEPDNNSILPPLPNRPSRINGTNGVIPPPLNFNSSGASILHQPVHIATPAPSPPPSPPIGGKAGKKQNYQTNQNFPFMYPPLDSSSSGAGGKGAAGIQDFLVGRKWEGSDIPKSILEAGDLFANRMRMTRAMRQLWEERENFRKFERGWDQEEDADEDVDGFDLGYAAAAKLPRKHKRLGPEADHGPNSDMDIESKRKIDLVEEFYQDAIPHLQSLVIVLLKAILANVTALLTQPQPPQGALGPSFRSEVNLRANVQGQNRLPEPANIPLPATVDPSEMPIEEVEALRSREITAKAVAGIFLLLLKWYKLSHILKFEYLTQLLLDSNYLPLVLKLFAHQDVDKMVDSKTDRDELSFFAFCNSNSLYGLLESQPDENSEDDAAPPPIKLTREFPVASPEDKLPALAFQEGKHEGRREVHEIDELAESSAEQLSEPITEFSWRNFFSSINFLRIMQKICKNKAHRNLLLVTYKSSNILKKSLKIPQPELRLYTLKLFKNQVPYCGRKWRQGNMRVITAIYLHCRPELRDDWLAGSDVDAEVEEALPLEQALRALTHWHNIKRYPDQMGADTKLLQEEHDFFVRELERIEWLDDGNADSDSAIEGS